MRSIGYKNKNFKFNEPFDGLFTQGMVCHETYQDENNNWLSPDEVELKNDYYMQKNRPNIKVKVGPSESMSKSKKNVIDPEKIINNYGSDAVRFFILSDSPPEKDVQWSEQGMASSFRFVQKFWTLHQKIKEKINQNLDEVSEDLKIKKFTNQTISKITHNLENFTYNVIIANMHETYNFMIKHLENELNSKDLLNCYKKILILFSPILPHQTSECLEDLGVQKINEWPKPDPKYLEVSKVDYVVQINGKKRSLITADKNLKEKDMIEYIRNDKTINKYLNNKKIKKTIFIPNKLINILL